MPAAFFVAGRITRLAPLNWIGPAISLVLLQLAALLPFVAFAVVSLLAHVTGERAAVMTVWRRGVRLWSASLALVAAWVVLYLVVVDQRRWSFDPGMTWDLLSRSVTHGIIPGLAG